MDEATQISTAEAMERKRPGGIKRRDPLSKKALQTHGKTNTKAYRAWRAAKSRCSNPKDPGFKRYGGRGIRMSACWADSFEAFLADMGEPPDGTEIDRIDNNGHYEHGNCRWATAKENARNRRDNHLVTINGETKTLIAWIEQLGLPYSRVVARIYRSGWDPVEALTEPPCQGRQKRKTS